MLNVKPRRFLLVLSFIVVCILMPANVSVAQEGSSEPATASRPAEIDLDVQLHLIVASNAATDGTTLSAQLAPIARQLQSLLPFANYRLGATFLCRVKNGRPVQLKGVGRILFVTPILESSVNPTFYEVTAGSVTMKTDASGNAAVQLSPFRFGLRIPLLMAHPGPADQSQNVVYEPVGITTDVTIREGEPVVVGTMDAGRPNETLVVVLLVKRASPR